ncbi:SLC13 family permease [Fulvimarina endophytica]|uniref:SLC13 family permease n=1 Tax=Fulvimarina endophytica TaxID=2293836 RepID=A0A371WY23_9HYPH|nr:SLC13 family permease [Fulvimarina endophytica]RFC61859.1 SLC13 family permease [Fulvimarina endophytica]
MTLDQALAFSILFFTVAAFVWGRLPYDLVALGALFTGVVAGIVPLNQAFSGFADDVVVIVAAALIISKAIAQSGFVEDLMRPLVPAMKSERSQVPIFVGAVLLMSMVTKNIGALAIFMPIVAQTARRTGTSVSRLLMPMSFASLIGGLVTLVGTSPNIIVSKIRDDIVGEPFRMFDYAPVGLGIAAAGFVFLSLGSRLLPQRKPGGSLGDAFSMSDYTAEARIGEGSAAAGKTVSEIEALADDEAKIQIVIRERFRRYHPAPVFRLADGDILIIQGDPEALARIVARAGLDLFGEEASPAANVETESIVEAVVTAHSPAIGRTVADCLGASDTQTSVLAVSRNGETIGRRFARVRVKSGDVLVLKGTAESVPETLANLKILPLAERQIVLGRNRRGVVPIAVLALAMLLTAFGVVNAAGAFFGAAVVLLLLRVMSMNEAYHSVEASVIVLLAALIPLSEAIETTGGTTLIADALSPFLATVPPIAALAVVVIVGMAVTPFLNNAATVLMLAPIAGRIAIDLGLNPDPFLMGVALGAACDFLTPIGHQCNTIVMGPGGYRFGDYWRLGLPLSIIVVVVGVPLISVVWPLS